MATWQWFVLAIPALVLIASIVMIIRTLLRATQTPAEDTEPRGARVAEPERAYSTEDDDSAPVELGEPFDSLFVEGDAVPSHAADDNFRRPESASEPETVSPRRVTESPS